MLELVGSGDSPLLIHAAAPVLVAAQAAAAGPERVCDGASFRWALRMGGAATEAQTMIVWSSQPGMMNGPKRWIVIVLSWQKRRPTIQKKRYGGPNVSQAHERADEMKLRARRNPRPSVSVPQLLGCFLRDDEPQHLSSRSSAPSFTMHSIARQNYWMLRPANNYQSFRLQLSPHRTQDSCNHAPKVSAAAAMRR